VNIPISIQPERLSTISSNSTLSSISVGTSRPPVLSTIDDIPESPILGNRSERQSQGVLTPTTGNYSTPKGDGTSSAEKN
jgi:hypothetical protein